MQLLDAVANLTAPTCSVFSFCVVCLMLTSVCVKTSGGLRQHETVLTEAPLRGSLHMKGLSAGRRS